MRVQVIVRYALPMTHSLTRIIYTKDMGNYQMANSLYITYKDLYAKNRMSENPAFLLVIAFLKLIQGITK